MEYWLIGGAIVALVALLLYWLIYISEGAYLGSWAVRWLYDRGARSYDRVKEYNPLSEAAFLGNPLLSRLEETFGPHPLLLDVATGTARLPLALLVIPFFEGEIVGVDISRSMLREAARKCGPYQERVTFLHHPAVPLPFQAETFDAVTSLEALEFLPDRRAALREMVRVLRPGGWLLVTNRIGMDARLMPGRTDPPRRFEEYLDSLGLVEINTRPWQEYYDLILARKPGEGGVGRGGTGAWLSALQCPHCEGVTEQAPDSDDWLCAACGTVVNVGEDGVWELSGHPRG